MIHQTSETDKLEIEAGKRFFNALAILEIPKLLKQSNIRKDSRRLNGEKDKERRSAYTVFVFLIMLVFQGQNLFRYLESKKHDCACSKNTYYRFLNDCHFNWSRFISLLSAKVISLIEPLTDSKREKCLVLDDSVIARERSKKVELLARIFDHVIGKTVRGFNLLTLGWTDHYSFIPVGFNMMSSAKNTHRIMDADGGIDKRTNGYKARIAAMMQKPDAAIALIQNALNAGITARYLLIDTWFTNEPFINRVLAEGLDVIGMVKDNRQKYWYRGRLYGLRELARFIRFDSQSNVFGSVSVKTKFYSIPVRLVFVRNRNKRDEYIVILTTDCFLQDSEVVRYYGSRWSIECCFKVCKSMLKLGQEFQGIGYDMTVSTTAIVFTRFILLEWIRREDNDPRTMGELFFLVYDEVKDIELSDALRSLMTIFAEGMKRGAIRIDESVRIQLVDWFISQPLFIQALFPTFIEDSKLEICYMDASLPILCQETNCLAP